MTPADPTPPLTVPGARVVVRRLRTAQLLAALIAVIAMVAMTGVATLALVPLFAVLAGLASWMWAGRVANGALVVDDHGVMVGEGRRALRFERADVLEAMAIPGASPKVQLTLRGGTVVEATVESLEVADAVLDRVAPATGRRALRFPARALWQQALGAFGGVVVGSYIGFYLGLLITMAGFAYGMALAVPLSLIFGGMGVVSTRPVELRVGTDGLTLRGAFKTRFVPFAELAGVGENGGDPMLYYRDGHSEVVWNSSVSKQPDLLAALQHRVNGALAANAEHEALMARAAVLGRRGRTLETWRAEVARAVDPTKGYRDVGLSRRETEALLNDVRSPIEHRIAAAMALRSLDGEEGPTRIRVAAEGCASPEMRAALERVSDGTLDEATVQRAVAAVEKGRGW